MENIDNNGGVSVIYRVKLDQVATWFVSAFFNSLERCACVNLSTTDFDDDEAEEEAKDRPLCLSTSDDIV